MKFSMRKQRIEKGEQMTRKLRKSFYSLFAIRYSLLRAEPHRSLALYGAERGFTLMLAALVASVALALATSIFSLAQKELTLSSVGRDSQFAFYAADSGAECTLYWDIRFQLFPTSTPMNKQLSCDGEQKTTTASAVDGKIVSIFEYEPNGFCAKVTVTKGNTDPRTVIHVDGYNTTCANITTSARALERSVELKY